MTGRASVAERAAAGRAARRLRPRSAIASWAPAADRRDPIDLLIAQEADRVAELVPIRHARMARSPFAFYRGAAAVMAADLGAMPSTGLIAQLCGDAHLSNFGLFAAPDRAIVFDVNDFDETFPGPFEWDAMRLAASFVIAARDASFSAREQRACALEVASSYRATIRELATQDELTVFYERVDASFLLGLAKSAEGRKGRQRMEGVLDRARRRDRWSALRSLTKATDDGPRFVEDPPLLVRIDGDSAYHAMLEGMLDHYRAGLLADRRELVARYRMVDLAHKVVGVGSVGLRAFVVLMQGRDASDQLILQAKQAVASVLEPPGSAGDHGQRVVDGQRLIQAATDVFLGSVRGPIGRSYYVRQLRDMKWSPDVERLRPRALLGYATLCGRALARAHARAGDPVAIGAYLGSGDRFDRALADFAERYAEQNERDHAALLHAIADGRITAATDERAATLTSIETGNARVAAGR